MTTRTKHTKRPTYTVKHIGDVYVDTGQVWIGDPCHFFREEDAPSSVEGQIGTWEDFCNKTEESPYQFDRLGIRVPSGWGDGIYPVFATFDEDGKVTSVTVQFLEEDGHYTFDEEDGDKPSSI